MTHAYVITLFAVATRTAIVAVILVVGLRLSGKRRMAQLNIYDLALVMTAGNAVQNAMTEGSGRLLAGIVSAAVLIGLSAIAALVFVRSPKLQDRIVGSPTLILNNGKMLVDRMRREGVTKEELLHAIRQHGLTDLKQVMIATLEIDGAISIVPSTTPTSPRKAKPHAHHDHRG